MTYNPLVDGPETDGDKVDHRKESEAVCPRRAELAVNFLMTCDGSMGVADRGAGEAIRIISDWVQALPKEKITRKGD